MFVMTPPRFTINLTEENEANINKSIAESETITFRPICCCYCGSFLLEVGDDIVGHIAVKCQKCKGVIPLNPAYFHRSEAFARIKRKNQYLIPLS